jgi:hypothetical protein
MDIPAAGSRILLSLIPAFLIRHCNGYGRGSCRRSQSASEIDASVSGSQFLLLLNAGIKEPNLALFPKSRPLSASEMDTLVSGSQFLPFQRQRSSSASEMDTPVSGSQFLPFQRQRSSSTIAIDAPASGSQFLLPFQYRY